ncbi:MAG: TIGR03435 family protein [Vicinamibacterales bacterium]
MKREQQTNSAGDVLANVGDSLREWAPPPDEERGALDRVWNGLRWKARHVPAEAVRSVELGQPAPRFSTRPWALAAAAALVVAAIGGAMVWPRGVRVYAAGADGLQFTLADDSRVEMRAHSELTVGPAADGIQIDLTKGDIIVTTAEKPDRHLYVRTKDMTVAIEGTALLVNAGRDGSRVGVIEGEVRVRDGSVEKRLRPGEQVTTSSAIVSRPLTEDITWSRRADAHRAVLAAFQKAIADTAGRLQPLNQAAATALGGAPAAASQTFEEASVRPCDPDNLPATVSAGRGGSGPNAVYMTPGRFYALCMTPATLIRTAYGYRSWNQEVEMWFMDDIVPGGRTFSKLAAGTLNMQGVEDGRRVRGGPDWMRTERYTIEAVAGDMPADKDDACISKGGRGLPKEFCSANAASMSGPMLRALLERRFGLKAHVVTEQTTAYNLVIAPGGLKMKEGVCNGTPRPVGLGETGFARWQLDLVRQNLDAARRGDATTGSCGLGVADNGPNRMFVGAGAGKPPLQGTLEAPVFDRTGIPNTTRFNYALEFLVEQTIHPFRAISGDPLQIADNPSSVQPAPNLFTALEQQLGLRLERTQVPREYIVIDAIRRPDPN